MEDAAPLLLLLLQCLNIDMALIWLPPKGKYILLGFLVSRRLDGTGNESQMSCSCFLGSDSVDPQSGRQSPLRRRGQSESWAGFHLCMRN